MFSKIMKGPMKYFLASLLLIGVMLGGIATGVHAVLPDAIVITDGTTLVVADSGTYSGDYGAQTDQIDLDVLGAGAARQSDKLTFTGASRGQTFNMHAEAVWATAPNSGETLDYYIGFSTSCTAGTANVGATTGSDAAYTGSEDDSLDDTLRQLMYIGSLVATIDITGTSADSIQRAFIGSFIPISQCGNLVVDNSTSDALSDASNTAVAIVPNEIIIQESAP